MDRGGGSGAGRSGCGGHGPRCPDAAGGLEEGNHVLCASRARDAFRSVKAATRAGSAISAARTGRPSVMASIECPNAAERASIGVPRQRTAESWKAPPRRWNPAPPIVPKPISRIGFLSRNRACWLICCRAVIGSTAPCRPGPPRHPGGCGWARCRAVPRQRRPAGLAEHRNEGRGDIDRIHDRGAHAGQRNLATAGTAPGVERSRMSLRWSSSRFH
jgi:hypothetical protein